MSTIAATCAALWLVHLLAPALTIAPMAAFVFAFVCVCAATLLTSWHVPVTPARTLVLSLFPAAALLWIRMSPNLGAAKALMVTGSLLGIGTLLGSVIGSRIQAAGHLLFVAIVSSAVDVFSVFAPSGPTATLIATPQTLHVLALPWPMLGTGDIVPILGVGDVVFAALYRGAARAHGVSPTRTMTALGCGFGLTLVTLLLVQLPIPALPFLGLCVVALVPQARAVPTVDRRAGWIGVAILLTILGLLVRYRP